jgi:hypothetical protein
VDSNETAESADALDPETGFIAVAALRRLAERLEAINVLSARQNGWSWQQIGDSLGITRQSAFVKYGKDFQ